MRVGTTHCSDSDAAAPWYHPKRYPKEKGASGALLQIVGELRYVRGYCRRKASGAMDNVVEVCIPLQYGCYHGSDPADATVHFMYNGVATSI